MRINNHTSEKSRSMTCLMYNIQLELNYPKSNRLQKRLTPQLFVGYESNILHKNGLLPLMNFMKK